MLLTLRPPPARFRRLPPTATIRERKILIETPAFDQFVRGSTRARHTGRHLCFFETQTGVIGARLGSVQLWWKHCLDREFVALEEQRRPDTSQEFQRETMHQRTWVFGGLAVPKSVLYEDYKRYCQNNRTVGSVVIDSTWSKELGMLTELTHYRARMPECVTARARSAASAPRQARRRYVPDF